MTAVEILHALPRDPAPGTPLTRRQRQVLILVAAGRTNGQIARELHMTATTAQHQVGRVLRKLDAANRAQAVDLGWRAGYLTQEGDSR